MSSITCPVEDLPKITAQLVKEGVIFKASPAVNKEGFYLIEFTGGF